VREAEYLCYNGVRELVLIGQDTAMYGRDNGGPGALPSLLDQLVSIDGCEWIRLMYAHPAHLTDDIIDAVAAHDEIVKYIDLPLQHINDKILTLMNRKIDRKGIYTLIKRLRSKIPGISIRTTFIVGFPGETDRDFRELLDFCEEIQFDHVGIFKYSREEGTPAEKFPGQIEDDIKEERYLTLMDVQNRISREKLGSRLGRREKVLLHEVDRDGTAYGRAWFQAPEIDGQVVVKGCRIDTVGFVDVEFEGSDSYDLISSVIERPDMARFSR
jgi:ribosomal protein S12 methylthiotransferase